MFRVSLAGHVAPDRRGWRSSRSCDRRTRSASSPTPSTSASGRGRTAPLDIQAGRIPPVFGAFARRTYGADNPLIGYPLAYQYLTSLRPDAVPATADDLLAMRARGWRASYPVGVTSPAPACRSSPPTAGTRACRRARRAGASRGRSRSRPARSRTRAWTTTTTDGRCPARVAWKPVVGLVVGALRGARRVPDRGARATRCRRSTAQQGRSRSARSGSTRSTRATTGSSGAR